MFSDPKKNRSTAETEGRPNRIGKGTQIKGDIVSDADFRIDGSLQGEVKTSGKIVVGKEGHISGTVECVNADIEGKFDGELHVKDLLSLKASAVLEGSVVTGKLSVEPGAVFNASCAMSRGTLSTSPQTAPGVPSKASHETAKAS